VFPVLTVVLGQPLFGLKDRHSDLVKAWIGWMHQYVQIACHDDYYPFVNPARTAFPHWASPVILLAMPTYRIYLS
jgi:hypothetical protein